MVGSISWFTVNIGMYVFCHQCIQWSKVAEQKRNIDLLFILRIHNLVLSGA